MPSLFEGLAQETTLQDVLDAVSAGASGAAYSDPLDSLVIDVQTTSTPVLGLDLTRSFAIFQNVSDAAITLRATTAASPTVTVGQGFVLAVGAAPVGPFYTTCAWAARHASTGSKGLYVLTFGA